MQTKPQKLYASVTSMWNTILDGYNGAAFHSPEFWTSKFLKPDAAERWPLLTGSIVRIHAKMHSPYFDYNDKLRNKYGVEVYTKGFRNRTCK